MVHPEYINCIDCKKRTPLHAAAYTGNSQIAFILLEHGARVNAKDFRWVTPLHRACAVNADETVDVLLKYEADVCARDKLWQTPLHIAAAYDAYNCIDKLLGVVPNPNITDRSGWTALHHAAFNGNTFSSELLINRGCIVNACDKRDYRPLHCAVQMGHSDTVELLLRYGADINAKDRNQYTPLHVAVAGGLDSVARLLLSSGADVNTQNAYGNTPMHVACLNGHLECCQELASSGADLEAINFRGSLPKMSPKSTLLDNNVAGQAPLHVAAASKDGVDCLAFLLENGVNINRCSNDGRTPLHMTAIHGRFTRSKTLIDHGALIDVADKNGSTPLHIAAQYGHDILANTLLSFGASPTRKGYEGRTPLHMCCLSGFVECCRKFLQTGVNLNEKDDSGRTPIHCAAYKGFIQCLDLLTSNAADFALKDDFGRLPLHYAAAQGHFQCVFTLVGIGSPINDRDIDGCTPLHLAASYDQQAKCVEYLLDHKADPKIRDAKGKALSRLERVLAEFYMAVLGFSALHYAIACGNEEGVNLLLNATEESVYKKEGVSPNITPLHLAVSFVPAIPDKRISTKQIKTVNFTAKLGSVDVLKAVLTKYSDVNIQTEQGITPLILVAREGFNICMHVLLRFGAKVSLCDNVNQMNAVHYSAKSGQSLCLTLLLHNSDDLSVINMVDRQQRTALMFAVSGNHKECVQVLLQCGADPNLVDADKHSCLFRAVRHQAVDLDRVGNRAVWGFSNAEVSARDVNGKTVLHLAGACGHLTCLQLILQYMKEADVVSKDNQDCTVLHWACYHGHAHCVEHLLSKGLFKELDGNVYSPVHCACFKVSNHGYSLSFSGSQSCLEHLIEHFGDHIIHLRDEKQRTPLHIAALHGHAECASMLLNLGAAPLVVDSEGRTPLIAAAQYGQSNVVELLLSCKIDLSACDNDGNTALHWACLRKHHQTALLILESCQDAKIVDVSNNEKKTPLHLAARNGLVDVTRELLKKGANVLAIDNEGLTPALSCAPNNNVAHCLALILQMLPDCLDKANKSNDPPFLSLLPFARLNQSDQSVQTQTHVVLVTDPDLFQLKQAFLVPEKPKSPKRTIKVDQSRNFYIKEMQPVESKGAIPKHPEDKGRTLHRSDKELHLPKRPRKSYNAFCKDCGRLQRLCLSCRKLMELKKKRKQRAVVVPKESAFEGFDKVFLEILAKTIRADEPPMAEKEGDCKEKRLDGDELRPHLTGQEAEFLQLIETNIAELLDKEEVQSVGELSMSDCDSIIGDSWPGESIVLFKRTDGGFKQSSNPEQGYEEGQLSPLTDNGRDLDNPPTELGVAKSGSEPGEIEITKPTPLEGRTTKASNTNLDQSNAMRMALKDSMSLLPGLKELKGLDSNHSSDN
ncbi:hypothetical protein YQE_08346, partial [Dendroctonus ponderosae]